MQLRKKQFLENIKTCLSVFSNKYRIEVTKLQKKTVSFQTKKVSLKSSTVVVLEGIKNKKVISVSADIGNVFLRKIS
jgi:hypothetical protein